MKFRKWLAVFVVFYTISIAIYFFLLRSSTNTSVKALSENPEVDDYSLLDHQLDTLILSTTNKNEILKENDSLGIFQSYKSNPDLQDSDSIKEINEKPRYSALALESSVYPLISKNATSAGVTAMGYKSYIYLNSDVEKNLSMVLGKHGVQKDVAEKSAIRIANSIKGYIFKRLSVFITITGAVYTIGQNFINGISVFEKLSMSIAVGLVILLLYILGSDKGIMK